MTKRNPEFSEWSRESSVGRRPVQAHNNNQSHGVDVFNVAFGMRDAWGRHRSSVSPMSIAGRGGVGQFAGLGTSPFKETVGFNPLAGGVSAFKAVVFSIPLIRALNWGYIHVYLYPWVGRRRRRRKGPERRVLAANLVGHPEAACPE